MSKKKDWKKLYQKERKRLSNIRSEMRKIGYDFAQLELPTLKEVEKRGLDFKKLYQKASKLRGAKKIGSIKVVNLDSGEIQTVKVARETFRKESKRKPSIANKILEYINTIPDYREFFNQRARLRARINLIEHKEKLIQIIMSNLKDMGDEYERHLDANMNVISNAIDAIFEDSKEEVVKQSIVELYDVVRADGIMVESDLQDAEDIFDYA